MFKGRDNKIHFGSNLRSGWAPQHAFHGAPADWQVLLTAFQGEREGERVDLLHGGLVISTVGGKAAPCEDAALCRVAAHCTAEAKVDPLRTSP